MYHWASGVIQRLSHGRLTMKLVMEGADIVIDPSSGREKVQLTRWCGGGGLRDVKASLAGDDPTLEIVQNGGSAGELSQKHPNLGLRHHELSDFVHNMSHVIGSPSIPVDTLPGELSMPQALTALGAGLLWIYST